MSLLRNEFPKFEGFGVHDTAQRVAEDVRVTSVIVTPLQFFEVTIQMLDAHLVERAHQGPLEEAPDAFNAVGVYVTDNPFLDGVVDGLVPRVVVGNAEVGLEFVRVGGFGFVLDGAVDEAMEGVALHVRDTLKPHLPVTLDGSRDDGLVALVPASPALHLAAHVGFVHFDNTDQRRAVKGIVTHGFADTMAEIPSRLVGDSKGTLHLLGGNALLGFAHEVYGEEPLTQGQVGIMHDGSSRHAELVAT